MEIAEHCLHHHRVVDKARPEHVDDVLVAEGHEAAHKMVEW